ncbi:MAG: restriction endonuclease subunit S [Clostridiales bacterium]|nr:restriction endonuclease subunit S [Clostridiales bacterium]
MKYKLKDIFDLQMGKTPPRNNQDYWNTNDNKWISIADLSKTGKYISKTKECLSDDAVKNSGIKVIPANTVVMSFKLSIGKTAITAEDMYSNEAIMAFHDRHVVEILPEYIFYMFKYKNWDESSNKAVMGKTLNKATLSEVVVEICPIEKQREIVTILDKMMDILSGREQELQLLDDLIKARFVEMFGDPVCNPLRWEKKTLKEVCIKLNDGTHFSPESFETGEYKYVTAKNIKMSGFDFTNITYVPEEVHRPIYERCNPELGDVLYIKDGVTTGIAMVNTLEEEFTLLSSVALLKQDRRIMNGHFLSALLNDENMYTDIRSNMGGAAITRLTIAKLNTIKVILPPIELQTQFAAFVEQTNKSKAVIQKALDKTQLLFDSLMQKYFG